MPDPDPGERLTLAAQQSGGPFPHWDNPDWDHPVRFLDAIRLWSPAFARRLDQLKWPPADEILTIAQQRHRHRTLYDHPTSQKNRGRPITEAISEPADDMADSEIPESLREDAGRLLREWRRWDDTDRLVSGSELAAHLIIEKTKPGQPYLLKYAPPASRGDLSADYVRVAEARHDGLLPGHLDIANSMIRNPGSNWLPARILGGTEAEGERMRVARLAREAGDAAATATWNEECAKPMRERQYFLFGEIADALARKPGRVEVDTAERDRIVLDLADWTRRSEFDLSGDSEVVTVIGQPPYFVPIAPVCAGGFLANPETLILRRDACRRYVQNSPLDGAPRLLTAWFPEPTLGATRPNPGARKPDNPIALVTSAPGHVMPPDEAEGYTLLWDAADEMPRANGQPPERNWLRLMDAFWRGDLAPNGLTYFCPGSVAGREFFVYDRTVLAGMLLGHAALDSGKKSIDQLRHWRVADYQKQPDNLGKIFARDHEGRLGLAVLTQELDRWRHRETGTAKPVAPRSDDKRDGSASRRRGPEPGTVDRYGAKDRALFPELKALLADGLSVTAAALRLAEEGKIAGVGASGSKAKRLADRYRRERR